MQDLPDNLVPTMAMNILVHLKRRVAPGCSSSSSLPRDINIYRSYNYSHDNSSDFRLALVLSFLCCFAARLSCTLRCLAILMSAGAQVRTCFTRVGTNDELGGGGTTGVNQAATSVGRDVR